MGAGWLVRRAERVEMRSSSLARGNTCSCHPREWGLKKGLRRARRRLDKTLIERSIEENETCDEIDEESGCSSAR